MLLPLASHQKHHLACCAENRWSEGDARNAFAFANRDPTIANLGGCCTWEEGGRMAVVAKAKQDQIKLRWSAAADLLQRAVEARHIRGHISPIGGDRVKTGVLTRPLGHQASAHHAGVAERVIGGHIALIAHQQINPVPGQMFLAQQAIGGLRCGATREGDLNAVPLRQGEVNDLGDRLGSPFGQTAAISQLD